MSHSHGRQESRNNRWQQRQREESREDTNRNRLEHRPQGEHSGQEYDRETENRWEADPAQTYAYPRRGNSDQYNNDEYESRYDPRQRAESWQDPRPYDKDTSNREWVSGTGQPPYRGEHSGRYDQFDNRQNWSGPNSRYGSRGQQVQSRRSEGSENSGSKPSFAGRGPQGYKRSDDRITEDISEEMTLDHDLDATNISIETTDGEVILKGTVSDRDSKRRAEEIAESCSGVKDVQNQIRVTRENTSEADNDAKHDKRNEKRSARLAN